MLSLVVNLLGLLVDFNEQFLRLGSNDNFVFNWAAFPPLAHWHILQEGLVDLIWLQPGPEGWQIQWPVLLPALLLLGFAAVYLILAYRQAKISQPRASTHYALRITFYVFALTVAAGLTLVMMQAAARFEPQEDAAGEAKSVEEVLGVYKLEFGVPEVRNTTSIHQKITF